MTGIGRPHSSTLVRRVSTGRRRALYFERVSAVAGHRATPCPTLSEGERRCRASGDAAPYTIGRRAPMPGIRRRRALHYPKASAGAGHQATPRRTLSESERRCRASADAAHCTIGRRAPVPDIGRRRALHYRKASAVAGHRATPGRTLSEGERRYRAWGKAALCTIVRRAPLPGIGRRRALHYRKASAVAGHRATPGRTLSEGERRYRAWGKAALCTIVRRAPLPGIRRRCALHYRRSSAVARHRTTRRLPLLSNLHTHI